MVMSRGSLTASLKGHPMAPLTLQMKDSHLVYPSAMMP